MGTFTPLVLGINGRVGKECQLFLKHLAEKIAPKDGEQYNTVITWLRTLISFELLRSVHACVRGTRVPFFRKKDNLDDCELNVIKIDVFFIFL